ncbi:MAG: AGE family epimerase/isomerase [Clostridia bacterium]|nr:AGE family epimerase/isomerase [Clostridia bacterium]
MDKRLAQMAMRELTGNILPFWLKYSVDHQSGGYYGEVGYDGTPDPAADRCLILNARILWTFAAAYRILGDEQYLKEANRAYAYFIEYFIDPEYGGAYFALDSSGAPKEDFKMVYGQAFAIYALSEYHRATGHKAALGEAIHIFELLETHAFDPANLGYKESFQRNWELFDFMPHIQTYDAQGCAKSMNTHLHLIEAYTSLLRVWRNPRLEQKVREHLEVMLSSIVNHDTGHYHMYFELDWTPLGRCISYGHDIEGSWLMAETIEVLGDEALMEKAKPVFLQMASACLDESVASDGSMIYEFDPEFGHRDTQRSWWVQAEAVVGFLNAWQLGGEQRFLDAALKTFAYINHNIADHEFGEWFSSTGEDGRSIDPRDNKASAWKCPYHNARMCLEIIERYGKI